MVGMLTHLCQNDLPDAHLQDSLREGTQCDIDLAPSEGLFLNQLHFDYYNRKTDIPCTIGVDPQAPPCQALLHSIYKTIFDHCQ